MAPRQHESDNYGAKSNNAKKLNVHEKVIGELPWQQIRAEKNKITPPCACHLCGLVAFLVLSILTFSLAAKYPAPTDQLRSLLGQAPPELYLNIALAVYIISELFYIILRSGQDGSRKFAIKQLLFFSAFYIFFWYAEMLQAHFNLLAVSGIILQIMESFRRAHSCKTAKAETEAQG